MSAPKKFASMSRAANPTAMPPMPPNASTPEMLNPRVCMTTSVAVMMIETRSSFAIASRVARSGPSSESVSRARRFSSACETKRTRNHAMQATTPTSRAASTASKMVPSPATGTRFAAKAIPTTQMNTRSGRRSESTRASSHGVDVRSRRRPHESRMRRAA